MKRFLAILLMGLLTLSLMGSLTACKKKSEETQAPAKKGAPSAEQPTPQEKEESED